jgi:hypothetical protein
LSKSMKHHDGAGRGLRKEATRLAHGECRSLDPWELVWGQPFIDAATLAKAIDHDLIGTRNPDFRTRLLVRDASRALRSFLGPSGFTRWLAASPAGGKIRAILQEELGRPGFRYIRRRLVSSISLTDIKQVLQLLGEHLHGHVEINIAGSVPTLIHGLTARPTDDIDIVNEVPAEIRAQRATLQKIKAEFGLNLGHVQSHYLPANWQSRRQSLGDFGGIRAYLVDPVDIFVSKLSSKQEKHKQDLRVLAKRLDAASVKRRLLDDGKAFLDDPFLRPQILENWQFIYQESLLPALTEEASKPKPRVPKPKGKTTQKPGRGKKRPT